MRKILVNAIPLTNVSTGISRYLRCLYGEIERRARGEFEVFYFDGVQARREMPTGPENLGRWSLLADLFWRLPPHAAYLVRRVVQARRERAFRLAAQGFDLYHEAGFFPFVPPPGIRTVFTIHDMSVFRHPEYHPRERILFMRRYLAERTALAQRILTVSEFSKREIVACLGLDPARIRVTPLAPDPVFALRPEAGLRRRLEREFGLPPRYFLFVGSGDPRKNVDIVPRAIALAGGGVPLVCVGWKGWGSPPPGLEMLSLGYLSDADLADVYAGALALIFPSIYEGFGLPVVEAQACGCPVVTTREASLPEVGGDAALYLEHPRDADELAGLLRRLMDAPGLRDELSRRGVEHAGRFSWAGTAERTCEVFRQVLGEG
ncbi:MAG: glycosyltransferase family 4 protein [Desulfovibrionaceae bacterium]